MIQPTAAGWVDNGGSENEVKFIKLHQLGIVILASIVFVLRSFWKG